MHLINAITCNHSQFIAITFALYLQSSSRFSCFTIFSSWISWFLVQIKFPLYAEIACEISRWGRWSIWCTASREWTTFPIMAEQHVCARICGQFLHVKTICCNLGVRRNRFLIEFHTVLSINDGITVFFHSFLAESHTITWNLGWFFVFHAHTFDFINWHSIQLLHTCYFFVSYHTYISLDYQLIRYVESSQKTHKMLCGWHFAFNLTVFVGVCIWSLFVSFSPSWRTKPSIHNLLEASDVCWEFKSTKAPKLRISFTFE